MDDNLTSSANEILFSPLRNPYTPVGASDASLTKYNIDTPKPNISHDFAVISSIISKVRPEQRKLEEVARRPSFRKIYNDITGKSNDDLDDPVAGKQIHFAESSTSAQNGMSHLAAPVEKASPAPSPSEQWPEPYNLNVGSQLPLLTDVSADAAKQFLIDRRTPPFHMPDPNGLADPSCSPKSLRCEDAKPSHLSGNTVKVRPFQEVRPSSRNQLTLLPTSRGALQSAQAGLSALAANNLPTLAANAAAAAAACFVQCTPDGGSSVIIPNMASCNQVYAFCTAAAAVGSRPFGAPTAMPPMSTASALGGSGLASSLSNISRSLSLAGSDRFQLAPADPNSSPTASSLALSSSCVSLSQSTSLSLAPYSASVSSTPAHDDTTRKREMRLQKNREAAKECRRKKKEYVKCLEMRVASLEKHNETLIEELKKIKSLYCQIQTPGSSGGGSSGPI